MSLPPRIPRKAKRASRWRSQAHLNFVRSHACCNCGETARIEVAHVRMGSGAGLAQKPDDWRTVSLCGGLSGCHAIQHRVGEPEFWANYKRAHGSDVEALISAFIAASPRRAQIQAVMKERENA